MIVLCQSIVHDENQSQCGDRLPMIGFCPLASGSKGNCLYVGTSQTKILIDAGLSTKAIGQRLSQLGVRLEEIRAILVTHEHIDHIRALGRLGCKLEIPIFCNSDTARAIYTTLNQMPPFKLFTTGETFALADLQITPFSIQHDAIDPVAFTLQSEQMKLGVCADLGIVTTHIVQALKGCDYLYIEANHEPSMVHASARPQHYKQRVLGRQGHLSNDQCAQLLTQIAHPALKQIYLGHLSSECNNPDLALLKIRQTLQSLNLDIPVAIALQESVSLPTHFAPHVPCSALAE